MPVNLFDTPMVAALVLPESTGTRGMIMSNYPVNRTDISIIAGTPNTVQFFVRDIDRQVIGGSYALSALIVDASGEQLLLQRNLISQDPAQGLFALQLAPLDTLEWPLGSQRYSITATRPDGTQTALYTDRDYSPVGQIMVRPNPLPTPPAPLSLDPSIFVITDQWASSSAIPVSALQGAVQTVAVYGTAYTGSVKVQGTVLAQPDTDPSTWFDITQQDFMLPLNGVAQITTGGLYTFIRVQVVVPELPVSGNPMLSPILTTGAVTQLLVLA